jgi:AcrR family transcriptional regulator
VNINVSYKGGFGHFRCHGDYDEQVLDDSEATQTEDGGAPTVRRRKRGLELHEAIYRAVLSELQEHGYAALSMDRVASRAQTGKATLYRRWPSKLELVVDAFQHSAPDIKVPPDSGDLREELLAVLRQEADSLDGASGAAARGLMAELVRTPELARVVRPFLADPLLAPMMEVLRRAAVRGEIPVAALTPRIAAAGPDIIRQHAMINSTPIPPEVLVEVVDGVILPLLRGIGVPQVEAVPKSRGPRRRAAD